MRLCGALRFSAKLCVLGASALSFASLHCQLADSPKVAIFSFIELWQTWRLFEPGTRTKMV